MKKYIVFILSFLFILYILSFKASFSSFAQNSSQMVTLEIKATTIDNYIINSTLKINTTRTIPNASFITKLFSQGENRTITTNGTNITITDKGQLIAYNKSPSFNVTSSNLTQQATLEYPSTIKSGEYNVTIELLDENGSPQAVGNTTVKISGSDSFLNIQPQNCQIKIGKNTFNTVEGPIIGKNEKGILTCTVENNTSTAVSAKPHVVYAMQSITRTDTKTEKENFSPITIEPGKSATITIDIPQNIDPQVYEGYFKLVNTEGRITSPVIPFRWIISGPSATIQNITPDKTYYASNETAKITIAVAPSADLSWRGPAGRNPGFSPSIGSDLKNSTLTVTIRTENNQICGKAEQPLPSTKQNNNWDTTTVNVPISINCQNPQIKAAIYEKGIEKPLAVSTKNSITNNTEMKKVSEITATKSQNNVLFIIIILVVALIIGIIIYLIWRRRKNNKATQLPPPVNPPIAILLLTILVGLLGMYVGTISFEKPAVVHAGPQFAPFQGSEKQPSNSTDPSTRTVTSRMNYSHSDGAGPNPEQGINVRDFAENRTGGDSHVSVDPLCKTIQITVSGSATSTYMCINWAAGLALANFVDNAPVTPTSVSSPTQSKIKFPGTEITDSAFNPNAKAIYGPHIFTINTFNEYTGQRSAAYTLSFPNSLSEGQHTLLVQAAASNTVSHDYAGGQENIERFFSSFENIERIASPRNPDPENNCGGTQPCFVSLKYTFTCGPPACGNGCTKDDDCAGARNGCTACVPNDAGVKVCAPPPACGASCQRDDQCAGAKDGCTSCVPNNAGVKVCAPPPACGVSCQRDDQCVGAKDGCTGCVPNNAGTGKVCSPPPACGTACTRDDQCAGAKNGCNFCSSGKCSAFSEDMCSCDGMDFVAKQTGQTFFPGDDVTFVAYGKVPGKDWKGSAQAAVAGATITSVQFSLYESKASDPNNAIKIAESTAITPVVVENTATKVRYKVTWDRKIPASPPAGAIYRVQAKLKCSAKPGVLGTQTNSVGTGNYFTQLFDSVAALFAKGSVLGTTDERTGNEQQATTFSPAAQILEKSCTILRFSF